MAIPITSETVQSLVNKGIEAAKAASNNKLDFAIASPGSVLMEGFATIAAEFQSRLNEQANTIELNRLALLGIEKQVGVGAVGTVKVTLGGAYSEAFQLPAGYEITIAGVTFETVSNLTIPAFATEGTVAIASTVNGIAGNLPAGSAISYLPPAKVSTITLIDGTAGGRDDETDDDWKTRIQQSIRYRDVPISEEDFEGEAQDQLGDGSVALAVGRLKPNQQDYENGYVYVFALNPDGSQLNTAQISQLQEALTRKAAMATVTVGSIESFSVDVAVYAKFDGNAQAIAAQITQAVTSFLKPGILTPGEQILPKSLEYDVQSIDGILRGVVSVTLNGFEQPQSLPNRWTIGVLGKLSIKLSDPQGNSFNF